MNQSRMRDRYLSQIRRLGADPAQSSSMEEELYERLEAVRFQVKNLQRRVWETEKQLRKEIQRRRYVQRALKLARSRMPHNK